MFYYTLDNDGDGDDDDDRRIRKQSRNVNKPTHDDFHTHSRATTEIYMHLGQAANS